jgi:photosystem II stability/assembly factor-like uncharacterized protein
MRRLAFFVAFLFAGLSSANAQWEIEESHTTADLRGIHNVGGGVAWASGTEGTVLRTTDEGATWQRCTTPPHAEKLDFRGIQAFDENTAIVMSSGKGDLSRLYKTTDGCQTWDLLFTNPDKEGFWDVIRFTPERRGYVLGDPVGGKFVLFRSNDAGVTWKRENDRGLRSSPGDGAFAASNSSFTFVQQDGYFGIGGSTGGQIYMDDPNCGEPCAALWIHRSVPIGTGEEGSGVFSIAGRVTKDTSETYRWFIVAVGGIYKRPEDSRSTAAASVDGGEHWSSSATPPHGYRSAVAYDPKTKTWITVGPNGTDISRDDGRNWTALKPTAQDQPDADKNWNALSLPFVVGPKGRIGKLNASTSP